MARKRNSSDNEYRKWYNYFRRHGFIKIKDKKKVKEWLL